ncbi:Hypothetical protein A7982_05408 [Minicystis rosea]|nr:Hypothetical protein A7982_05408 [Minicystis rosea]
MRKRGIRSVAGVCLAAIAGASACSHAWGDLDPNGASSSSATGTGGGDTSSSTGTSTSSGMGGMTTSSTTSSSSGTGGSVPAHCGGTDILSWDFSADQPYLWDGYGPFEVSNGQGNIVLEPNAADWTSAALTTNRHYDLRGDSVSLEVLEVPNQTLDAYGLLQLEYPGDDRIFMDAWHGHLECGFRHDGNESVPMDQTYDPVKHRFWKLRESQGTIYCETSPNGTTWDDAGSFALAPSLLGEARNMRVKLYAGAPDHAAAPGAFRFDNLNGGTPPQGHWCRADSYSDDFAASTDIPGPAWQRWYTNNDTDTLDQTGGTVNFHFGEEEYTGVGYGSSGAYDMTGQRVSLELLQLPASTQAEAYFGVGVDNNNNVFWTLTSDRFECAYDGSDISYHTIWMGAAPALPAWVGFHEESGRVYCDILENGTWKSYGSAEGIIDPQAADVFFGAYSYTGLPLGKYQMVVDNYNLPPAP